MYHFINGDFFSETDANISVNDLSVLRGFGIFDYFRTYNKKPFLLELYLNRFFNSATIAGIPVPFSKAEISKFIDELISLNSFDEYGIRMILTGGSSVDAYSLGKPNFLMLAERFKAPAAKDYNNGVRIMSYKYQRDNAEAKLINYASSIIFHNKNIDKAPAEILYHFQGRISEASRSNIFFIKDKQLITAKKHILKGITRKVVLSIAKDDFVIKEINFPINQLHTLDEAFITSTTKGILPVVKIDDEIIGDGKVGKSTTSLMNLYDQFVDDFLQKE